MAIHLSLKLVGVDDALRSIASHAEPIEKANSDDRVAFSERKLTFKELRKIVAAYINSQEQQQTTLFSNRILSTPFWIWDIKEHKAADILTNGYCCFNHVIGLPKKNAQDKTFFDYEKLLFDTLQQHKHVWIKKATGLGIRVYAQIYGMALSEK